MAGTTREGRDRFQRRTSEDSPTRRLRVYDSQNVLRDDEALLSWLAVTQLGTRTVIKPRAPTGVIARSSALPARTCLVAPS